MRHRLTVHSREKAVSFSDCRAYNTYESIILEELNMKLNKKEIITENQAMMELSDDDLDQVTGGFEPASSRVKPEFDSPDGYVPIEAQPS